jgi:histidyl-tRNA synthetase
VLEVTSLFRRSIGDETDIVGKEMYSFEDAGGENLSLRPEGTAGAVRAFVQNSVSALEPVSKWYYVGPMFRRERPQKGRYRQFHQAGAEVFGAGPPVVDAELVIMLADFFASVGLAGSRVLYNHLGSGDSRADFTGRLVQYYQGRLDELCDDCKRRIGTNPLRLLDCKVDKCQELKTDAPLMRDCLAAEDLEILERYRGLLDEAGVDGFESPRLVRGLDYYTGLVFEVEVQTDDGPVVLCGGGRYDGLVEKLGGSDTPAAGYAIGLERLIACLPEPAAQGVDLFVLVPDRPGQGHAVKLLRRARSRGLVADLDPRAGSFKSQMKRADKLGSAFVAILGERELAEGRVSVKDMHSGEQREIDLESVIDDVAGRLGR